MIKCTRQGFIDQIVEASVGLNCSNMPYVRVSNGSSVSHFLCGLVAFFTLSYCYLWWVLFGLACITSMMTCQLVVLLFIGL